MNKDAKPATIAAQALGRIYEPYGDLAPPIYMSTTYERNADGSYSGPVYSRDGNPTYLQVEAVLCALEGGAAAAVTASGMAAATALFLALAPGDHVIAPRVMYWALRKWFIDFAGPWGLKIDFFDNEAADQLAQIKGAIKPRQDQADLAGDTGQPDLGRHRYRRRRETGARRRRDPGD